MYFLFFFNFFVVISSDYLIILLCKFFRGQMIIISLIISGMDCGCVNPHMSSAVLWQIKGKKSFISNSKLLKLDSKQDFCFLGSLKVFHSSLLLSLYLLCID